MKMGKDRNPEARKHCPTLQGVLYLGSQRAAKYKRSWNPIGFCLGLHEVCAVTLVALGVSKT